jgi:hypothetical protein
VITSTPLALTRLFRTTTRGRWDWLSPLAIVLLSAIGVAFIYSAQFSTPQNNWVSQLVWLAAGAGLYIVVSLIDYRFWLNVAHLFYFGWVRAFRGAALAGFWVLRRPALGNCQGRRAALRGQHPRPLADRFGAAVPGGSR